MRLNQIVKKSLITPVVGLISDWNYTEVYFSDGVKTVSSYTKKEVKKKVVRSASMTEVRRGVEVCKYRAKVKEGYVYAFGQKHLISRRKISNWAALILMLFSFTTYGQNTAPMAINDTILVCNDGLTTFRVVNNDFDTDGDRINLHSFTRPQYGDLVARGNMGDFDYRFGQSDTTSFTYKIIDRRFGGIGTLQSNSALVKITGAPEYNYAGVYTTNITRLTCKSKNTNSVTITGNTREVNQSFTSITLDASEGTVLLAPSSGGVIELTIKQ